MRVDRRELLAQGGRVLAAGGTAALAGCGSGGETPSERWSFGETQFYPLHAPIEVEDTLYVGTFGGYLNAFDAAGGTHQWRVPVGEIVRPPTVAGDTLLVGSQRQVAALAVADGGERWSFSPTDRGDLRLQPAVTDTTVYAADLEYGVHALDRASGDLRWQTELGGKSGTTGTSWCSPLVHEGTVYVGGSDGWMYGLDATTGEPVWSVETGFPPADPVIVDDTLFVTSWSWEGNDLLALDFAGETVRSRLGANARGLAHAKGLVFTGGNDGLRAFNTGDGTVAWRTGQAQAVYGPEIWDDTVYTSVRGGGGNLLAVGAMTGDVQWSLSLGNDLLGFLPFVDTREIIQVSVSETSLYLVSRVSQRSDYRIHAYGQQ